MSETNSIKQGGWWYEVTNEDTRYDVLLDVPENTKPLKSSEIVDIFDEGGVSIYKLLDTDLRSIDEINNIFDEVEKLLDESGYLD